MVKRVFNFSAGPAALPISVLQTIQNDLLDWNNLGYSVMEASHRSKEFIALTEETFVDMKSLLDVPDNYHILICSGGATMQFSGIPLNFASLGETADYFHTGLWSSLAIKEAKKFCDVNIVTSSENENHESIPPSSMWSFSKKPAYVFYTPNETVHGLRFASIPDTHGIPLVADMTSSLFQETVDIAKYGVIFAGTQKNLAPAGMSIVIVRDDLIGHAKQNCPSLIDYEVIKNRQSMPNTPPSFTWYVMSITLKWIKEQGGVGVMHQKSIEKSRKIYDAIDRSGFYSNRIQNKYRSIINIPFYTTSSELDELFIAEATKNDIAQIAGHRILGGMRASLYNAVTFEAVNHLIEFMGYFERKYG